MSTLNFFGSVIGYQGVAGVDTQIWYTKSRGNLTPGHWWNDYCNLVAKEFQKHNWVIGPEHYDAFVMFCQDLIQDLNPMS
tara:strand:+ start:1134 stop:1373 length:240 start_codon:yes stop_codon:yes gene_type:complete